MTIRSMATGLLVLAGVVLVLPVGAAMAQPSDSNIFLDAPGLLPKKPKAGLPDVKAQPLAWPRLDPGAVLCRSEDDLRRLVARRSGQVVDAPVDCQVVRQPTGISIVQRVGPGTVEVRTNDPAAGGLGWTDAWLPDRAPIRATSASSAIR